MARSPRRTRGSRRRSNVGNSYKHQKGTISRSQLLSTFGIGSLYEMRAYSQKGQSVTSVIIGGLDHWMECLDDMADIREPVLEGVLGKTYFKEPPEETDTDDKDRCCPSIPVFRFPKTLVCNACGRMGYEGNEFKAKYGNSKCQANDCEGTGIPARLIVTCFDDSSDVSENGYSHPGHIHDFPWQWWAHLGHKHECKSRKKPQLRLRSSGKSAGLSGMYVECLDSECRKLKVGRSLAGVFGKGALHGVKCHGSRPWLGDKEKCDHPVRALMRGASNVYFPVVASAISIPPNSTACRNEVSTHWMKNIEPILRVLPQSKKQPDDLVSLLKNFSAKIRKNFTDEQIMSEVLFHLNSDKDLTDLPTTEKDQRSAERIAIIEERSDCAGGIGDCLFDSERIRESDLVTLTPDLADITEHLVLVHRLREVRVLRGFNRLAPHFSGDNYTSSCAPLSVEPKNWLPAISVQGEGIYFELKTELIQRWSVREQVKERFQTMQININKFYNEKEIPLTECQITPAYVFVHTLAHLVLNQLSLDCGYSSASLRERLYINTDSHGEDSYGFMIYTSSSSADGTLGGLVRQGQPNLFERTFRAAVANSVWCSSDPLCVESLGQGVDALNLAACHACSIISETSCEHQNLYLDRGLVVGTSDLPEAGFFSETDFI